MDAELMDDPQLPRAAHLQALRGLTRINTISFTVDALWPWIRREALETDRPLRVLDVATGGGDVPLGIARRAQALSLPIEVAGCDIHRRAIAYSRLRARQRGLPIRMFQCNVLEEPLPGGYDVITSSLFLHHLQDNHIVPVLRAMAAAAERLVLVDDLCRSKWGLLAAKVGTRILSRSPVVHVDGPRSVRAALTAEELEHFGREAGLANCDVMPHWPQRQILVWHR
jgi:2-polyprenyl-3-methyl-5-hydroxy-6-metoxy-1,4-benzoquinol methylase